MIDAADETAARVSEADEGAPSIVAARQAEDQNEPAMQAEAPRRAGCTTAQMRRFIKSRPYIPMHELRRRFQIEGTDDEVHGFDADGRRVFVGLPERESAMLGDLVRQGEVGYELLLDPSSPLVIGVFPIRPVPHP